MASTTVRISKETHRALRSLATQRQVPIGELIAHMVKRLQRHELLEQTNAAYAALRNDPEAWQEELKERAVWETTLADGIES